MRQRRNWIIGGGALITVLVLVYFLFFNMQKSALLNAMPADAVCFFDVNTAADFDSLINDETAFVELERLSLFGELRNDLLLLNQIGSTRAELLSDLKNKNFIAGAFNSGENNVDYLFLLDLSEAAKIKLKDFLPLLNDVVPTSKAHKFERTDIYELHYPSLDLHFTVAKADGIFFFSTSTVLVENAVLQLKSGNPVTENDSFKDVYDKMDKKRNYSFYLNLARLSDYFSIFSTNDKFDDLMKLKSFGAWIGLEMEFIESGILLKGFASQKGDNIDLLINNYSGELSSDMNAAVPENAVVVYRINSERLTENIALKFTEEKINREYFDYWSPWMGTHLIFGVSESLNENYRQKAFLIIPANDQKLMADKISYCIKSDSLVYRGYTILEVSAPQVIEGISGVQFPEISFATVYENNLIITAEKLQLRNMIDAIESRETLIADADYAAFASHVSTSFNNSVYINPGKGEQIVKSFISSKKLDSLENDLALLQKFPAMEFQFSNSRNIVLVNGFIQYSPSPKRKSGRLWKVQLDLPAEAGPFSVYNANTEQNNIIVQDTSHTVYLISANGDIIWKKQLNSKIIGKIIEVDFYGNNKNQLLFNTAQGIFLWDMSGNAVEGFPIVLTSRTTNPIAVLNKAQDDYRMFVACDNGNIYGFYKDGKPMPGWNPLKNAGNVEWPLFEITNKGQNFGFINESGVQIKNLIGKHVETIPFNNRTIAFKQWGPTKYLMDEKGNVLIFDQSLKTKTLSAPEKFLTGSFSMVNTNTDSLDVITLEEGYFKASTITGKNIFVAEAGKEFTKIVAGSFWDKDYFGVANNSQLLLFNANGKALENFPLQGSENFIVLDLTSSGDKMLITTYSDIVIAYRIQ